MTAFHEKQSFVSYSQICMGSDIRENVPQNTIEICACLQKSLASILAQYVWLTRRIKGAKLPSDISVRSIIAADPYIHVWLKLAFHKDLWVVETWGFEAAYVHTPIRTPKNTVCSVRFLLGAVENISRGHFGEGIPKNEGPYLGIVNTMKNDNIWVHDNHTTLGKAKHDEQKFGMPNAKFGTFLAFSNAGR